MSLKKYKNNRSCGTCGYSESRFLSEMAAAFDQTRQWDSPCPQCGNKKWESLYWEVPDLNPGLMEKWSRDEGLCFMCQEEETSLAEKENLPLLVKYLDSDRTLNSKRKRLFEALCVLLYDNIPIENRSAHKNNPEKNKADQTLAGEVKGILLNRLDFFPEIKHELYLEDHIKEAVYPELNLPIEQ